MICKRILILSVTLLMVLSFASCGKNTDTDNMSIENVSDAVVEDFSGVTSVNSLQTTSSDVAPETEDVSEMTSFSTSVFTDNPAMWTKAEIVEAYKKAAQKSNSSVKSEQAITLSKISVNNEELGGAFDFVKKIISKFISNNSTEKEGITGGYMNLTESDVYSAKAYTVGNNIAIEMVMRNQTDGARGDANSGSVGHAITVVGDISVVTDKLTELGLPIEISDEHTSIHYTNPVVKVLVDGNGKIIKGTWRYTVDIRLNNYKAFGADVDSSSIVMDNVITVNGGF